MTNEEIYENVMGHKPNKEFGIKGLFSWDDIDALMNAVKTVVGQSEQLGDCNFCNNKAVKRDQDGFEFCAKCLEA